MLTRTEINLIADRVVERVVELLGDKMEAFQKQNDEMMNSKQCAEWLGISVNTLHKRCESGIIPYRKRNGRLSFFKNEVQEYEKNDRPAS